MEPVTLEFVEQTADFMMHLTQLQLEERFADYRKRQHNMSNLMMQQMDQYKDVNKKNFIMRLGLIFVRCYESYDVKLPMISPISMKEIIKADMKESDKLLKGVPEKEQIQKSVEFLLQPHLFAYANNLFLTDENFHSMFTANESQHLYFMIMTFAIVYKKTIERYS